MTQEEFDGLRDDEQIAYILTAHKNGSVLVAYEQPDRPVLVQIGFDKWVGVKREYHLQSIAKPHEGGISARQMRYAIMRFKDAAEMLWTLLANVNEGDWLKQSEDWQVAAFRWRDNYFEKLKQLDAELTKEVDVPAISVLRATLSFLHSSYCLPNVDYDQYAPCHACCQALRKHIEQLEVMVQSLADDSCWIKGNLEASQMKAECFLSNCKQYLLCLQASDGRTDLADIMYKNIHRLKE